MGGFGEFRGNSAKASRSSVRTLLGKPVSDVAHRAIVLVHGAKDYDRSTVSKESVAQRLSPGQVWKTSVVPVSGDPVAAGFDGERSEPGILHKIARRLGLLT